MPDWKRRKSPSISELENLVRAFVPLDGHIAAVGRERQSGGSVDNRDKVRGAVGAGVLIDDQMVTRITRGHFGKGDIIGVSDARGSGFVGEVATCGGNGAASGAGHIVKEVVRRGVGRVALH